MKAFIVDRYGSGDRVRASEVPDPEMREDDVLIEIHAAGENPLDSKIRDGEFKLLLPYRLPLILGNELAGVVIRVGSRVRRFKPGDEVYARPDKNRIGTFAELITFAIQLAKHVGAIVATTTSTANVDLVNRLGADIVIDYKKDRFEEVLRDYDVVLNSLDGQTLKKSLRVLKPGGKLISISGPPDPEFARYLGLSRMLELMMRLLSFRIRRQAKC